MIINCDVCEKEKILLNNKRAICNSCQRELEQHVRELELMGYDGDYQHDFKQVDGQ